MDLGFEGGFTVLAKSINTKIHPEWVADANNLYKWTQLPATCFETIFANDIFPAAKTSWMSLRFPVEGYQERADPMRVLQMSVSPQSSGDPLPILDAFFFGHDSPPVK